MDALETKMQEIKEVISQGGPTEETTKSLRELYRAHPDSLNVKHHLLWSLTTYNDFGDDSLEEEEEELIDQILNQTQSVSPSDEPSLETRARSYALFCSSYKPVPYKEEEIKSQQQRLNLAKQLNPKNLGIDDYLRILDRAQKVIQLNKELFKKKSPYYLMSRREAKETFSLQEHFESNIAPEFYYQVYDEDVKKRGNFNTSENLEDDYVIGYIFKKDLSIEKNLIQPDQDIGEDLLVCGNLSVQNLDKGGGDFVILGNLKATGSVYGYYNHGALTIKGDASAEVFYCEDHRFFFQGKVTGTLISTGVMEGANPEYDESTKQEILKKELFHPEGYVDDSKVSQFLKKNQSLLKASKRTSKK